jgi:hypothetical protein
MRKQLAGGAVALLVMMAGGAPRAEQPAEVPNPGQPQGALSGASIFLSAGHGWIDSQGRWATQRGLINGVVEDHSNAEAVNQFLVPLLWNAGARVYTARERDLNHHEVVVGTTAPGVTPGAGWSTAWSNNGPHERDYLVATTTTDPAKATSTLFVPEIPESGHYAVYAWYDAPARGTPVRDARFEIRHAGGTTLWVQDQTRDGKTWKYLGHYWFDAGSDPERGAVAVSNLSSTEGALVMADAFRFGGGMSDAVLNGRTTGRPRFEDSGLHYLPYIGFDGAGDNRRFNSVAAMPRWAEWEAESWEIGRSIYLAWHTNASGSADARSRGLFSFVYTVGGWEPLPNFTGFPGGIEAVSIVHDEIIRTIHAGWDPEWRDGAKVGRWLGETNPELNNKMPAILMEYGFHDNPRDAAYILDPRFRERAARGSYRGLLRWYNAHVPGFTNTTVLPEKPAAPSLTTTSPTITLGWAEPPYAKPGDTATQHLGDRARQFHVYYGNHGRAFGDAVAVDFTTSHQRPAPPPGEILFARLVAINKGGHSLPGETLALRRPHPTEPQARVLIVNGFDRLDRAMNLVEESGSPYVLFQENPRTREGYDKSLEPPDRPEPGVGIERGIVSRMNTFDYTVEHARALAAAGYGFDSASDDAVAAGRVVLGDYQVVVWILGKERGPALDATERDRLAAYLAAGGRLFISGADLAEDLFGTPAGEEYLRRQLGATFAEPRAASRTAEPVAGSIFEGMAPIAYGTGRSLYPVDTADVLATTDGGTAALVYAQGTTHRTAAITHRGDHRVVYLAFPFESIESADTRAELMRRSMAFLLAD